MVAIATPVAPAPPAQPRRATQAPAFAPSLAVLAEAQQDHSVFAHDLGHDDRRVAQLRGKYARKMADLELFYELFDEPALDLTIQAADGRQLVLRLPMAALGDTYSALRDTLSENLRQLENQIVNYLRELEDEDELCSTAAPDTVIALKEPILALCAPNGLRPVPAALNRMQTI